MSESTGKRRGRPRKIQPQVESLPEAFTEARPDSPQAPEIDVVESYFSAFGDKVQIGKGYDGTVLNHRNYVNLPEGIEPRFGSFRPGKMERNAMGGFVPAMVDPKTKTLSPTGKPVVVGPPRSALPPCSSLFVRRSTATRAGKCFSR